MFIIHPQNKYSNSARLLAKALKGKRSWQREPRKDDVVINWGDGMCPYPCLNEPNAVQVTANKLKAFRLFHAAGVSIPLFATSKKDVSWKGSTVVRHILTGHSGAGIEMVPPGQELPDAPLYVEYIKKAEEYRVHVGLSKDRSKIKIIAIQRKARRLDVCDDKVNWQIRNHSNGFVYVRDIDIEVEPNDDTLITACTALEALSLDFGAVDIIFNKKENRPYVLEVNTAPGLEGQTVLDYATFFGEIL